MPKKKTDIKYYEAVGRRKEAVARVRLYLADGKKELVIGEKTIKKGEILVNQLPVDSYFPGINIKSRYSLPLSLTENVDRFAISVLARGGGKNGQLEAMMLGISRALLKVDNLYKPTLKKQGLLTRDSRTRERRKVGTGGKARRKKQSPKR